MHWLGKLFQGTDAMWGAGTDTHEIGPLGASSHSAMMSRSARVTANSTLIKDLESDTPVYRISVIGFLVKHFFFVILLSYASICNFSVSNRSTVPLFKLFHLENFD